MDDIAFVGDSPADPTMFGSFPIPWADELREALATGKRAGSASS